MDIKTLDYVLNLKVWRVRGLTKIIGALSQPHLEIQMTLNSNQDFERGTESLIIKSNKKCNLTPEIFTVPISGNNAIKFLYKTNFNKILFQIDIYVCMY